MTARHMTNWKRYDDTLKRIIAAVPNTNDLPADWPERIINAMPGMGDIAWQTLDERDGYRDLPQHFPLIRQLRNSAQHGPRLFQAINAKRKA